MSLPWSDIPIFLAVARRRTLSAAAQSLELDRTTVSRRLENIEGKLGHALFDRKDGNYILSPFGRSAFAAAECAEHELSIMGTSPEGSPHKSGRLRVSMSEHLLITLADCFTNFAFENPDILLELTTTDRMVDLSHLEADVVLRLSRETARKLDTKNIGKPVFSLYRSTGKKLSASQYIARPSEKSVPKYLLPYLPNSPIVISVDGLVSMRELIASGAGVGILPNYFADRDKRIECCSEPVPSLGFSLQIAYIPEQRKLYRLKTFVNFVEQYLRSLEGFA